MLMALEKLLWCEVPECLVRTDSIMHLFAFQQSLLQLRINPFRKKGRAATDCSSTPHFGERARVLRSMAGGASYLDYEKAYGEVRGKGGRLMPASAISAAGAVGLRAAQPEGAVEEPGKLERARETSDLLWRNSNYKTIRCECGTTLRTPPKFKVPTIRCLHCGGVNKV